MSRGGFGGGRGGFGGGANRSGPQQLMSFDLIKDLGVNGLFNVQTDLFPVSQALVGLFLGTDRFFCL